MLAWEPPRRLVLASQLDASFKYDPALITEVEVVFTALSATRTQVDFEHRNLERIGPNILGPMSQGWDTILGRFVGAAAMP